ncbi:hypothetical protein T552_01467 [Pneumocystis carinii B80]|uniref:General transcription and DNA repair factor IIH subunit TFB4 n=1 Tax=Pneumocystis carinii (strain B80) TaxID=1408658 RepID=A0A0W4ZKD5_PNEC8|nr:hypothetical protein T552_01467 [Pneumocystis carinii B80]KTW28838.1 hypothetical protein T552_01467 [Pneumocystis carinii B80]
MDGFKTLRTKPLYEGIDDDEKSNLLVVILDTNPFGWDEISEYISFDSAIKELLVFFNAHLSLNQNNDLAVLASHIDFVQYLYPTAEKMTQEDKIVRENKEEGCKGPNLYWPFYIMNKQIKENLEKLIDQSNKEEDRYVRSTMLGGSLCMALAYVNRCMQNNGENRIKARIFILSVSSDITFQYIAIMNCIFSAQKKKIPIDVCKIGKDTVFLQQASDATKGIYLHLDKPKSLLQYLMMVFLPDQKVRQYLVLPFQLNVDFRAACFCHKKIVDIGYVCSVCLSIFCIKQPKCLVCDTIFDTNMLQKNVENPPSNTFGTEI